MQPARELLLSLKQRGVNIWANNGQIRVQAPDGSLISDDLARIRAAKLELLKLLESLECDAEIQLQPRTVDSKVPLTTHQLAIWNDIIDKQQPPRSVILCIAAISISGPLDIGILEDSIKSVAQHHDSLRTTIVSIGGVPEQHIDDIYRYDLKVVNALGDSPVIVDSEVRRIAKAFIDERAELSVGPLFRAMVIRLSSCEHVLILIVDHIIADNTSTQILSRDIWTVYGQTSRGMSPSLPKLPVQFPDYAIWEQRAHSAWAERHDGYWTERFGRLPYTRIPISDALDVQEVPESAAFEMLFDYSISMKLRELARRERTLLALILLTVYASVMFHWCNRRDLIIVFPENGRHRSELENMIGLLMQELFLKIEGDANDGFRDLLRRAEQEFHLARDHGGFTPTLYLKQRATHGITDLRFNWLASPFAQRSVPTGILTPQLSLRPFFRPYLHRVGALPNKFLPYFSDTVAGIRLAVVYRPDLVGPRVLELFSRHMQFVSEEFVRDPERRIEAVLSDLGGVDLFCYPQIHKP